MDIQFFGAAKMVTGSNYLITTKKNKILIDCGMFQGNDEKDRMNYLDFAYDIEDIDYLILTHAHIDHSGRIPKLVKDGFKGKILCTKPTFELCEIMLLDSAKIQEQDAQWENKKRVRAGRKLIEPLYTIKDAEDSLRYFQPYFYDQRIILNDEITIRFKDAGHILGSSIVEIWIEGENNGHKTKIVFSGDLGISGRPIIRNPEYIEEADYLILESTYGDTNHVAFKDSTEELIDIINRTALRGGTVIIPSFAVGRTQELIYELNNYYEYNTDIEEYMKVPIYIDSPMAVNATEVFQRNSSSFDEEAKDLVLKGDNPFIFSNLRYIKTQEESMLLNKSNYPKVIISSSGMATAGRVRHHLKHNLWNQDNSLVFVGYQAEGTLGRILLDGAEKVKLLGEEIDVQLEIYNLEGFSGHADQKTLIDWIDNFKVKPKKIFLVHGEEGPANALGDIIKEKFGIETIIPNIMDKFNIKGDSIELKKGMVVEPALLQQDIENELENAYNQMAALIEKTEITYKDKIDDKNYDQLKNKIIELQHSLMDLNILFSK
ncbi:MBL fold metallo-hydrolase RNA specificity domain-containing protein [Wansuia hejianensis]|uniref:MBL fold metallo-hydrolase n=1 Tax=Wansuia hejianensis TaxID=2763667 RepID=A0A926EVX3_9FIRM|nr:MBL fold metallo-hydrolase [Wansuia hejianensis]MBC8590853.1 MBL fold metallo-hydrolase [Wansuia hejianensis]